MAGGPAFEVALEVKPVGAVRGTREMAGATKELTEATRQSGQESRKAKSASEELAAAERRRLATAADMVRAVKSQITVLAEYQKQLQSAASAEAARAATTSRTQAGAVASTGVDPSSRLGTAMQALLVRERQLRASIQETAAELVKADKVASNIAGLQARTKAMEGQLAAAKRGEAAERAYAEALAVRRAIEASGARPGTDQAAAVEKEVRAQLRLEAELRAVAAARELDRRAAAEANAQRDRVAGEVARLRETTHQLEVLTAAHRRGGSAVQAANVSLEVRNALLRTGVSAGSADAVVIEQQIRAQARLRGELDQATAAKRRAIDGAAVLRNAFFALQGAIAALGLSALIRDAVQVAFAFDRANKSFVAATGSQAAAAREMAFVRAEAGRLGLVLLDASQGYSSLANAAKGTVLEGQAARNIFTAVAEASTVLGLSADQTKGALLGVQQTISKGKVTAEELVQQISERLPGAYQAMATSLGISTTELGKRLEQGKVGLKDLVGWAEELRKRFSAGLLTAVNSDQANINRLRNMINDLKAEVGSGFLAGFLAGFSDLKREMSGAELKQAARDLGESIGGGLRTAADGAAFLARNLELVKAVLLAILALKAASWFVALAAAIAQAAGATLALKAASSNLALAGGLAAVAVVLLVVVAATQKYIAASRLAMETELTRVEKSQELFGYYATLKANKVGLTEAEWELAKSIRATMEAEKAALAVSLARTRAQFEASKTLNPIAYLKSGPGRNALREQVAEGERELQTLENQLNILDSEWSRLGNLPTIKLPDIDTKGLDKTANKIADLLETFRRAALQAERIAKANAAGASEAQRVADAIERENAAYQALHSIQGLSAASRKRLTEIIEAYVGRTQEATRATAELVSTRERDLEYTDAAREAEARLADAKAGGTEASRALAAALEAEAIAREFNREEENGFIATLTEAIAVRNAYLRSIDAEIAQGERTRQWKQDLAGLEAQLADAQTLGTAATRAHAEALEVERLRIEAGITARDPLLAQLQDEVRERALARAQIEAQIATQDRLNEAQRREIDARADFADWQEETAAVQRYGAEIAGILSQYGLLNAATHELFIQEEILAAIRAEGLEIDARRGAQWNAVAMKRQADIAEEIRQHYDYLDVLQKVQAQHALAAYWLEPLKQGWVSVKAGAKDALIEMAVTGEANFEGLAQTLARTMLDAIYQMVVRWNAAHKAMQAEAMKTAAVNAAAAQAGGGGFSNVSGGLGSFNYGFGGAGGAGAAGAGGSGGGAAMGGLAAMGATVAIFAAIYFAGNQWLKTHKKQIASATLSFVSEGKLAVNDISGNSKQIAGVVSALEEAGRGVIEFIKAIGGTMTGLENDISLRRKGQGKKTQWTVFVGDIARSFGKDYEAALEYAAIQIAREGTYKGLDPIVAAAIKRSQQEKWDAFQKDIELAQQVALMGKPAEAQAQAQVHLQVDFLINEMLRILGPSKEFADAVANITANMVRSLQAQRDQITGQQRTAEEEHQVNLARAHAWNNEKAMRLASVQMMIAETRAKIEVLKATNRMIGGGGGGQGESGGSGSKGGIYGAATAFMTVGYAATVATGALVGMNDGLIASAEAYLAALERIERDMAAIPDIKDEEVKKRRKGGGGDKASDRESLKNLLDDAAWAEKMRGLSAYMQGVAELNKKWDDARKLAHGNAKELERVEAARQAEIAALRETERLKLQEELRPFLADYGKSDWDLRLQELRKQFEEARKKAMALGESLDDVSLAEERAAHALGRQAVAALGLPTEQTTAQFTALGDTLNFVRNNALALGITQEELGRITAELGNRLYVSLVDSLLKYIDNEEARRDLEELRYQMEIANIKLQFVLVQELGVLTEAQVARVQALIDGLPATLPPTLPAAAPPAPASGGFYSDGGGYGSADYEDPWAKIFAAVDRVKEIRATAMGGGDEFEVERLKLVDEIAALRAVLAPFPDQIAALNEAYALALEDIARRRKERDDALLQPYEDLGRSAFALEREALEREFQKIRETIGNTERVQAAYALGLQDIVNRQAVQTNELLRPYEELGISGFDAERAALDREFVSLRESLGNSDRVQAAYVAALQDLWTRQAMQADDTLRPYEDLGKTSFQIAREALEREFGNIREAMGDTARVQEAYALAVADLEARMKEEEDALLRPYEEAGLSQFQREMLALEREFAGIREAMGDTARVQEAYGLALQDLMKRYTEGLRSFYESLKTGADSGLTIDQQYAAASEKYAALLANVQAGDYSKTAELQQQAEKMTELAKALWGSSTGGFAELREKLLAEIGEILAEAEAAGGGSAPGFVAESQPAPQDGRRSGGGLVPVPGGDPIPVLRDQVSATEGVGDTVDISGRRLELLLTRIADTLDRIEQKEDPEVPVPIQYAGASA